MPLSDAVELNAEWISISANTAMTKPARVRRLLHVQGHDVGRSKVAASAVWQVLTDWAVAGRTTASQPTRWNQLAVVSPEIVRAGSPCGLDVRVDIVAASSWRGVASGR